MPADSLQMQVKHDADGQFLPGQSGNAAGRANSKPACNGSRRSMASLLHRTRRAGLQRRLAVLTEAARRKVAERQELREKAQIAASIRAALAGTNVNPARITVWWTVADAEA